MPRKKTTMLSDESDGKALTLNSWSFAVVFGMKGC